MLILGIIIVLFGTFVLCLPGAVAADEEERQRREEAETKRQRQEARTLRRQEALRRHSMEEWDAVWAAYMQARDDARHRGEIARAFGLFSYFDDDANALYLHNPVFWALHEILGPERIAAHDAREQARIRQDILSR